MRLLLAFLLPLVCLADVGVDSDGHHASEVEFRGKNHWSQTSVEMCSQFASALHERNDLHCHTYYVFFEVLRVEVLSLDPFLVVFRNFYDETEADAFLDDVAQKNLQLQKVQVPGTKNEVEDTARNANGTWIGHHETQSSSDLFWKAARLLPSVNFMSAEQWQVLAYKPGGHYAPHFDYLVYNSEADYDWWMKEVGNRFATFLTVLKTADVGGGTVFTDVGTVVKPNRGDVIFWQNMDGLGMKHSGSMHGACPIVEGEKIAATLWIRIGNQPTVFSPDATFDIKQILEPCGSRYC